MKRLLVSLIAVACVSGPIMATATEAAAQHRDRYDRRDDRYDRRDHRRDARRDHRRDHRRERWDSRRHNGYYYRNRWHYGAPPSAYYNDPYYRPGYAAWRRGAYLPRYYRSNSYRVYDYGRYRLRPPPRGYYWYRSGDDFLLAAIATGLIYEVIRH
ncbi:MAG: RcnB family protein [Caulobacter sp.]|nr:RcnB family protein [Caulobacter sp.]